MEQRVPELQRPQYTGEDTDEVDAQTFREETKEYAKQQNVLKNNIKTASSLIWGQCTRDMREKDEADPNYKEYKAQHVTI
eukprot:9898390-Ditylum_brightwellii.AAC.1